MICKRCKTPIELNGKHDPDFLQHGYYGYLCETCQKELSKANFVKIIKHVLLVLLVFVPLGIIYLILLAIFGTAAFNIIINSLG